MIIRLDKGVEIEDIQFLEIDDSLLKHDSEFAYEEDSIYILHYPFGNEIRVSFGRGLIKDKKNEFDMIHKCKTNLGSSGSPIFDLSTNKVIGIHKGYGKNECVNLGTFLKYPLTKVKTVFQKSPKKISNDNTPINERYKKIKNPQNIRQYNNTDRNDKNNFGYDNISRQELRAKNLVKPINLIINNDNISNYKIIRPDNNPYNNHAYKITDVTKDNSNKIEDNLNDSNYQKKNKNFIGNKKEKLPNNDKIIIKNIQNNSNIKKINNKNEVNKNNPNKFKDKENIQHKDNQNLINIQAKQNNQNINI